MSDPHDPYAPGHAALAAPAPESPHAPILLAEARVCAAGQGAQWVSEGWALFKTSWDVIIGIVILQWLISATASMVPFLGNLVVVILGPVFSAGLLLAIQKVEVDERPDIGMMFAGFTSPRLQALVLLGVAQLVGSLVLLLAVAVPFAATLGVTFMHDQQPDVAGLVLAGTLVLLVATVAIFFYAAFFWFALPLVLFHGVRIPDAMRQSMRGMLRNWASLTVYGAIALGLSIAAGLTLFLALIVVGPVMTVAYYRSYRAIFTAG